MLSGRCFCGFVRYEVDGVPVDETNCHCSICRRVSAAPFVSWFTVPVDEFQLKAGEPQSFRSSNHGTRTFCPRCGSPLTFRSSHSPGEVDITICSLDQPEALPPKDHTRAGSQLPWIKLDDELPVFLEERRF